MNTRLNGCWTNKLVSLVSLKDTIDQVMLDCNLLETCKSLTNEKRHNIMLRTKDNLLDAYLMLQSIFDNDSEGLAQRCKLLNSSGKREGIELNL